MAKKPWLNKENITKLLKVLAVFLIYALIGLVFYLIYLFSGLKISDIQSYLTTIGIWGYVLFIFLQVFTNVVLFIVPGQTLQFIALGLALYSPLETFFLVLMGMVMASSINFLLGRFLGAQFVIKIIGAETYQKYQTKLATKAYVYYPLMMLLPFFPDDELTLLVGLTKMKWWYFIVTTTITRAVGVAIFTFLPGQINFSYQSTLELVLYILGGLHIAVLLFYVVRTLERIVTKFIK